MNRGRQGTKYLWAAVCACFALAAAGAGVAAGEQDDSLLPWKKAELSAGLFVPIYQSELRLDSKQLGRGAEIDLEDDLGLDSNIFSYRIDALWRFYPRHTLSASYYDLSRDSDKQIGRTLQIGDRTFTVGANVATEFDIQIFKASYGYSFIHNEKFDVSANLGVYLGNVDFSFSAPGIGAESGSFLAPLPVIGLRGSYAITPNLFISAGTNVFFIKYEEFTGSLIDATITLDYDISENFGVGIGYNPQFINIKYEDDNRDVEFDFDYGAIMAYLRVFM